MSKVQKKTFPFKSPATYLTFVQRFDALVSMEFAHAEDMLAKKDFYSLAGRLPALIAMVDSIGYLRGQDGFFLNDRPVWPKIQRELYRLEDASQVRLKKLTDAVNTSKEKKAYVEKLTRYYIKARTK